VPGRVAHHAAPAVRAVGDRSFQHAATGDGPLDRGVRVGDLDVQRLARAAAVDRGEELQLRKLLGQHQDAVTDDDLGVPDPPVRHQDRLAAAPRAERVGVERDRLIGIGDGQVRGDGVRRRPLRRCGLAVRGEQRALDAGPESAGEPRVGRDGHRRAAQGVERVGHRDPPSPIAV
jgi:hypothetical protein